MAGCNCGKNAAARAQARTYVVTTPGGEQKTYKTEIEAIAATRRNGGTYRIQS